MRYPRILVYERDGKLSWLLEKTDVTAGFFLKNRPEIADQRPGDDTPCNWMLRQPRQLASFLRLLRGGGPAIVVIHVAAKLEATATAEQRETEQRRRDRAFRLLERLAWLRPESQLIAVSDVADDALAGLAWELGATCVVFPPQSLVALPGLLAPLMAAASSRRGTVS
jgi:hypothetical protein